MKFVIVTGMSGSGKKSAVRILEDHDYFCVDNMPIELILKFIHSKKANGFINLPNQVIMLKKYNYICILYKNMNCFLNIIYNLGL